LNISAKKADEKRLSGSDSFSSMTFKGYGIELRPIRPQDLPSLRRWRNTPTIRNKMLDSSYITPQQQRVWFEYILNCDDQAQWVVWCKGGKTGYVNIKGEGPLQSQPYVSGGYYIVDTTFRHPLLAYAVMMMYHDIIFDYIVVPLIKGKILKDNRSSLKLNREFGYREVSESAESISFTLKASDYSNAKKKFSRYFKDPQCDIVE